MKTEETLRHRLSIDLMAHPDVAEMLARAERDTKRSRTSLVVECIREALPGLIGQRARALALTYATSELKPPHAAAPVVSSAAVSAPAPTVAEVLALAESQERGRKRSTDVTIAARLKPLPETRPRAASALKVKGAQP